MSEFTGGIIKIKPLLTEQPCVSECACMSVYVTMHVFMHVHVGVVTCLSSPHLLRPPTPPPYPPATAPHLTPPCPALQGLLQKKDEKGNRFPPLWGAVTVDLSGQLRALSSGQ